jgi:hypothetical protein
MSGASWTPLFLSVLGTQPLPGNLLAALLGQQRRISVHPLSVASSPASCPPPEESIAERAQFSLNARTKIENGDTPAKGARQQRATGLLTYLLSK